MALLLLLSMGGAAASVPEVQPGRNLRLDVPLMRVLARVIVTHVGPPLHGPRGLQAGNFADDHTRSESHSLGLEFIF